MEDNFGYPCEKAKHSFLFFHFRRFGHDAGVGINLFWRSWRKFAVVLNFPYWYIGKKYYYDGGKNVVKSHVVKILMIGIRVPFAAIWQKEICSVGKRKIILLSGPEVLNWLQEESMTPFDRLVKEEGLHEEAWGKESL